jgi:hypothetical protein
VTHEEAKMLADRILKTGYVDAPSRELLAMILVQSYELGWAHGRLARDAAEEAAERAKCGICKMQVKP